MAPPLSEDGAPPACLDHLKAQVAPTHPGARLQQLGGVRWPQELAPRRHRAERVLTCNLPHLRPAGKLLPGDTLVSIDGGAVKQGAALKSLLDPAKLLV